MVKFIQKKVLNDNLKIFKKYQEEYNIVAKNVENVKNYGGRPSTSLENRLDDAKKNLDRINYRIKTGKEEIDRYDYILFDTKNRLKDAEGNLASLQAKLSPKITGTSKFGQSGSTPNFIVLAIIAFLIYFFFIKKKSGSGLSSFGKRRRIR